MVQDKIKITHDELHILIGLTESLDQGHIKNFDTSIADFPLTVKILLVKLTALHEQWY